MTRREPRTVAAATVVAALAVLSGACSRGPATTSGPAGAANATVTRVVDGDTVEVRSEGVVERVRLIGVDTPESVRPDTPVECFALEASAFTSSLLPPGTDVVLVRDEEARDRYDRVLAYVYRAADGVFVNLELVTTGHAEADEYEPNVAHSDDLAAAARAARTAGRGLWGACPGG